MLSWTLLTGVGLLIMVVPLGVGRWFCHLLHVPLFLLHDPLNFIFGVMILHFGYAIGKYVKDSRMLKVCLEVVFNHFAVLYHGKSLTFWVVFSYYLMFLDCNY